MFQLTDATTFLDFDKNASIDFSSFVGWYSKTTWDQSVLFLLDEIPSRPRTIAVADEMNDS